MTPAMSVKMTDLKNIKHGLEAFLQNAPKARNRQSAIKVEVISPCSHFNLRGSLETGDFAKAFEKLLQQELPTSNTVMHSGDHRVYWLGPDEWLIVTPGGMPAPFSERLKNLSHDVGASLNDLSGGQLLLHLSGGQAEHLLSKGCPLDLNESAFPPGACAQTGLAKTSVLIARTASNGGFDVIVRRSFAEYLSKWLAQAGMTMGIEFQT